MRHLAIFILLVCPLAFGQTEWTDQEINRVFNLLAKHGAATAIAEVVSHEVTAYDFGIDLLEQKRAEDALQWFTALSYVKSHSERYLFGKAWVEMELGHFEAAMITANRLKSLYKHPLIQARAHYLLAVILKKGGSLDMSITEAYQSLDLYVSLNKQGGIDLCNLIMGGAGKVGHGIPPRDGSNS